MEPSVSSNEKKHYDGFKNPTIKRALGTGIIPLRLSNIQAFFHQLFLKFRPFRFQPDLMNRPNSFICLRKPDLNSNRFRIKYSWKKFALLKLAFQCYIKFSSYSLLKQKRKNCFSSLQLARDKGIIMNTLSQIHVHRLSSAAKICNF